MSQEKDNDIYSLSSSWYTDKKYLEKEIDQIFLKSWLLVGAESQISNPGDSLFLSIFKGFRPWDLYSEIVHEKCYRIQPSKSIHVKKTLKQTILFFVFFRPGQLLAGPTTWKPHEHIVQTIYQVLC